MLSLNSTQFVLKLFCLSLAAACAGEAAGQLFRRGATVELGIDRLRADGYAPLRGKRVGLITNQSGNLKIGIADGSYFGEEALVSNAPRNATVTMMTA